MKELLLALTFAFAWVSADALNYFVKVPSGTNACYIAGEMNNWQHQQMKKVDDTHFTIDLPNAKPTHKYKYSSGPSWGYVEKTSKQDNVMNRSYTKNDEVESWAAIFNPSVPDSDITYNVSVPSGTQTCYIVGGWDGWSTFTQMKQVDDTHFSITIPSNILFTYNYCAGNGWGYVELNNPYKINHRVYTENDVVQQWTAVYDKSSPDTIVTYNVTVPPGTKDCYIAGGWDGWSMPHKMKKVDPTHYTISIKSNKALRYKYFTGTNWDYIESTPEKKHTDFRHYSANDVVESWMATR